MQQGAAGLSGKKVMVVDDSNTIRRSAEIFLTQAGCEVVLATDGFDALVKVAQEEPDMIFVDVVMPRLNGYQICALLKRSKHKDIPVAMLSSLDGLQDRVKGKEAGSSGYLTKPFTKDNLLKVVEDWAGNAVPQAI
jgi:twitching motility two-component system response regulator PilG